jgi:hypothetical protein
MLRSHRHSGPVRGGLEEDSATTDSEEGGGRRSGIASGVVRGTPTLFIDGVVHDGGYDAATLMEALGI